jgi:hypothetical protein
MASHNISERKMVSQALSLSLGEFRNQPPVLVVTCSTCRDTRELRLSVLCERYGPDLLLGTIVMRMRCRQCRAQPGTVRLLRRPGPKPERGLVLRGT